jgi:hypothetical protein
MKNSVIIFLVLLFLPAVIFAQNQASEADYYELKTLPIPQNIELEVGGMATLPDGRLAVSTRRGEVWMVENPYGITPYYRLFAKGMHEVLGLGYHKGALYAVQRGELTKLTDTNGDGVADAYQNIANWEVEGNYHEYSYGPVFDKDDNIFLLDGQGIARREFDTDCFGFALACRGDDERGGRHFLYRKPRRLGGFRAHYTS